MGGGRIALAAVLLLGPGSGWHAARAGVVGTDGTITACYHKKKGTLRVVDAAQPCRKNELPLVWRQTGPDAYTTAPIGEHEGEDITVANLPPGSYVILAKAYGFTTGSGAYQVACSLTAEGDADATGGTLQVPAGASYVEHSFAQYLTHTFTSTGSATFRCDENTHDVGVWNPRITAIRVGTLTGP